MDNLLSGRFDQSSQWQQKVQEIYGKNYFDYFSVDAIAYDLIDLAASVRNGSNVYAYGLYSGSYFIHRVLQISPDTFDAVVMDGVCAGKYCNATLVDVNRNIMAEQMLNWYMKSPGNEIANRYGQDFDIIGTFRNYVRRLDSNLHICGATSLGVTSDAAYRLFVPNNRILIPVLIHRYTRCSLFDTSDMLQLVILGHEGVTFAPTRNHSHALEQHLILSEFARDALDENWVREVSSSFIYPAEDFDGLTDEDWQVAPKSAYYDSIANYTKPMLMLNGGFDQFNPLENATAFAKHFAGPNQHFVAFPADTYWTYTRSRLASNFTISCAANLVALFFSSPNSPLDTSCVQDVLPFSFNYTPVTSQKLKGNVWDDKYTVPFVPASAIISILYYAMFVLLSVVLFFALILQRNKQPIRSRHIYPYLGTFYVFIYSIGVIILVAFGMTGAFTPHILIIDMVQSIPLQLCGIASVMQMLRFLANKYIYKRMGNGARYNIALFKFFARERTFRIVVVCYTLLWAILWPVFYTVYILKDVPYKMRTANDITLCVPIGLTLVLFFYDIFIADKFKLIRTCGWKARFITADPLMFRLEAILYIPTVLAGLAKTTIPPFRTVGVFDVLEIIYLSSFLLMSGGLICIVRGIKQAHYHWLKRKNKHSDTMKDSLLDSYKIQDLAPNELLVLSLQDARGLKMISDYCQREFSLENLEAHKHLTMVMETYPTQSTDIRRRELAIFSELFLERNSPYELNLPSAAVDAYKKIVQSQEFDDPTEAMSMWKKASDAVFANLLDTFQRIKKTSEFEEYRNMLIAEEQITAQFH